jgi:hypothetical protein
MNFAPQSAIQRIQVGLIGLVAVLLFISIANMLFERSPLTVNGSSQAAGGAGLDAVQVKQGQDEPLAELGVAPAVSEQPVIAKQSSPKP